jgi:hypothetical protein
MGAPLVAEETGVRVDVAVCGRIAWTGLGRTVLGISTVVVLRPEAVEDQSRVLGALGCVGVRVAELRRPREVEKVVVEVLCNRRVFGERCGAGTRSGLRRGLRMRIARGEQKKKRQKRGDGFLLHGGSRITRGFKACQVGWCNLGAEWRL